MSQELNSCKGLLTVVLRRVLWTVVTEGRVQLVSDSETRQVLEGEMEEKGEM